VKSGIEGDLLCVCTVALPNNSLMCPLNWPSGQAECCRLLAIPTREEEFHTLFSTRRHLPLPQASAYAYICAID
jgi:hypothetical protein